MNKPALSQLKMIIKGEDAIKFFATYGNLIFFFNKKAIKLR